MNNEPGKSCLLLCYSWADSRFLEVRIPKVNIFLETWSYYLKDII